MPIPTTICDICQKTVNKAQTYAISDGKRACKAHPQTQTQATQFQQKLADEQARSRARKPQLKQEKFMPPLAQPRCFCCNVPGIRAPDLYYEMLRCQEKYELVYGKPLNPLDANECQLAYAALKGKVCLSYVAYQESHRRLLQPSCVIAAEFMGYFIVCPACCSHHKLTVYNASQDIKLDLTSLYHLGSIVKDVIAKDVRRELESKN